MRHAPHLTPSPTPPTCIPIPSPRTPTLCMKTLDQQIPQARDLGPIVSLWAHRSCVHQQTQVVTGLGEAGAALVASPDVDKIIFTGSPQVHVSPMPAYVCMHAWEKGWFV